ncbi:helix-turn-helix domain-containing protein [Streptomyces bacillaris]|uniref:helix-turn-helix domain-containing protein n=1 Tax=Streptomyces bacillaris TaxID=68179 RepID=UPI003699CE2F
MFDDSLRAIGERIAARRRARRLTQTALAAAAHVSYATVRSVERGARRPGDDVLEARGYWPLPLALLMPSPTNTGHMTSPRGSSS